MATFGTPEWTREQAPQGPTVISVKLPARRDGKFSVTYHYSARSIRAIITAEKLATHKADSFRYEVRESYR